MRNFTAVFITLENIKKRNKIQTKNEKNDCLQFPAIFKETTESRKNYLQSFKFFRYGNIFSRID